MHRSQPTPQRVIISAEVAFYSLLLSGIAAIALLDLATGNELGFFVFYFAPISVAAWFRGRTTGILFGVIATIAWSTVYQQEFRPDPSLFVVIWNIAVRFVAFLVVAVSMSRLGREMQDLRQMIPICGWCKKIRNDDGFWEQVESYFKARTKTDFTHGICPECAERFHKPNVLVVESDTNECDAIRYGFTKAGLPHQLHWVSTCEMAKRWLSTADHHASNCEKPLPDMLIIDLEAVAGGCFELIQWIRSQQSLVALPILVVSTQEDVASIRKAYETTADSCFAKSSDYAELTDFLRVCCL